MALAFATREAQGRIEAGRALLGLLLLIATSYASAYLVPACIGLASRQLNEGPRTAAAVPGSNHPILGCSSEPPQFGQRFACNLQNRIEADAMAGLTQ